MQAHGEGLGKVRGDAMYLAGNGPAAGMATSCHINLRRQVGTLDCH
jgi:hypothetical protein